MKNLLLLYVCLAAMVLSAVEAKAQTTPSASPSLVYHQIDLSPLKSRYARELFREKAGEMGCYTEADLSDELQIISFYSKPGVEVSPKVWSKIVGECVGADIASSELDKERFLRRKLGKEKEPKLPCQSIRLYFDTANCVPPPVTEGSYMYFNLCKADTVHFAVKGVYSQNGTNYTQHDTLHSYAWTFGDGTNAHIQFEPFAEKLYGEAKGYEMVVTMTDTNNCPSNPLSARVRIAGNPIQSVTQPDPYCFDAAHPGDTIQIELTTLASVIPFQYALVSSQRYDSTTFIPDTDQNTMSPNYCPPGHYVTDVVFSSFLPGQTITSSNDILSVCAEMEHGYMGDIDIKIICPNGQISQLKLSGAGGSKYLGEPCGWYSGCSLSDIRACDNTVDPCDYRLNPPGSGWVYCWSERYPTVGQLGSQSPIGTNQIDSTHQSTSSGYFDPATSFSNLIGCPMNGLWTIDITEHAGLDNGYIFSWELNLDPALLPQNWQYAVGNDTTYLEGPGVVGQNKTAALVVPTAVGSFDYLLKAQDEYGCVFDTTVTIDVIAVPDPSLGPDRDACIGETITLGNDPCPDCNYTWSTGDKSPTIQVNTTGTYWRELTSPENCTASDTIQAIFHAPPVPTLIKHQ